MTTPAEMRALATTLEEIAPHVETDYGPGQVATYGLAWEALRSAADEIEHLRDAITDVLPRLASIDDGIWREYTGDLVLKEDQWNAICAATRELRIALAGGEADLAPSDSAPGDG